MGWKQYLAELIGTFGFVLIAAGSVVANADTRSSLGLLGVAVAHGIALMIWVYATLNISGAHLNPAVTLGALVVRKIKVLDGIGYIFSQLIGAVLAGGALLYIYPLTPSAVKYGTPVLGKSMTLFGGVFVEALFTFFLVFVVFATVVDKKARHSVSGIAIGATLAVSVLIAGHLTGAALNPARALAPALAAGFWVNHWIYWVGPLVGGIIAALVYNFIQK